MQRLHLNTISTQQLMQSTCVALCVNKTLRSRCTFHCFLLLCMGFHCYLYRPWDGWESVYEVRMNAQNGRAHQLIDIDFREREKERIASQIGSGRYKWKEKIRIEDWLWERPNIQLITCTNEITEQFSEKPWLPHCCQSNREIGEWIFGEKKKQLRHWSTDTSFHRYNSVYFNSLQTQQQSVYQGISLSLNCVQYDDFVPIGSVLRPRVHMWCR